MHDSDPVLWTRIAALYVQLGRMGEAAKSYSKVEQLQGGAASPAGPPTTKDEAALLIGEADSFLRLGLIDKAVEHLAEALRRNPLLRVREPLVNLYVTQRQYKKAIAELWALLTPCANPQEEIRFLRYIIRLGDPDHAAEQRLKDIISKRQHEPAAPQEEATEPKLSVTAIGQELREYLGTHRPSTDLAPTLVFSAAETERYLHDGSPPPSATTRPNAAEVEAVAEEIALTSGGLKAELKEVDRCVQQRRHTEALRRLQGLAMRYPHSKAVQVQLQQLEQTRFEGPGDGPAQGQPAQPTPPAGAQSAEGSKVPLEPSGPGRAPLDRKTLEVDPDDIQEEVVAPAVAPQSRPLPPPPPKARRPAKNEPMSDAARAFRTGVTMRSFGQHEQAIAMFETARRDAKLCARATLMAGLCYRDLGRTAEAIASFMVGINTPEASEVHLSELFYELARSHELLARVGEAILFYRLSLGVTGFFRDSTERIAALQKSLLKT